MKCYKCGSELIIKSEDVGIDKTGLPIYHRFAYCDLCMTKMDIDSPVAEEKEFDGIDITKTAKNINFKSDTVIMITILILFLLMLFGKTILK